MSIVKDLVLISLFLIILIKYLLIYKTYIKQRDFFINTISHDLRVATIAQIRGLELLEKQNTNDSLNYLINEICSSNKFSLDMINMLLNSYKYENGEKILNYEEVFISDIVQQTSNKFSCLTKEKNIKIYNKIYHNEIIGDKTELNKLFNILLSIAIDKANYNSSIHIISQKTLNSIKISLLFKGKNFSNEEYNRMFSQNSRFSTVGHGIKLQLCKKIIDFHKGEIFVKNFNKDYSSLTFIIPHTPKATPAKTQIIFPLQLTKL